MERRKKKPPSAKRPPDLPVEIWQKIADRMTSRQWAKISITCRTTALVQPSKIQLVPSQIRHFTWLRRRLLHCTKVEALVLDMNQTKELNIGECAVALIEASGQLSEHLKIMKLSATVDMEHLMCKVCIKDDFRETYRGKYVHLHGDKCDDCDVLQRSQGESWKLLLAHFVRQASQVQTLYFRVTKFDVPLPNTLKHLLLDAKDDINADGCQALQQMPSLETLYIANHQWVEEQLGKYGESPPGFLVEDSFCQCTEALDMRASNNLCAVRFVMFIPTSLKVPPGCHVSVECDTVQFSPMKFCQNWQINDYSEAPGDPDCYLRNFASTLAADGPLVNITILRLDCQRFASDSGEPFEVGMCLENLLDLEIHSKKDVHVKFNAAARLERFVVMAACVKLGIPNMNNFAGSIKGSYFLWWSNEPCPVTAALLCEHVAVKRRRCPECSSKTEMCFPADADWDIYKRMTCSCDACTQCLGLNETFDVS